MKKLSIIIPVYNVEKYVGRCLDSCLTQGLSSDDYEIIVVNDGSPDNAVAVVEKYRRHHSHIRLVNRVNGGLSAARNTGLDEAEGEYVWFVDSDDRIEEHCAGMLVEQARKDRLDVLCFNLKIEYPDGMTKDFYVHCDSNRTIYSGQDFISSVSMPPAAWIALYRRDFLISNNLRFYEGILHEDQEFTPRTYCLAERIAYVDCPLYYYYQREGGIMKSNRNTQRCRDLLAVADSLYAFTVEHLEKLTPGYISMMQRIYFCVTQSLAYYTKEAMPLSEYRRKPYFPMKTSILTGTMKRKAMLANVSLRIYRLVYKILK
ncbi:MAG: glycosyltransferase [Coprobacter sp.]|nr:glycosyltransferase [Coprobacter sp.]